MKKSLFIKKICALWLILAFAAIMGCSSGGGSDTLEGRFVDTVVSGISYQSVNAAGAVVLSGVTDGKGRFKYIEGNTVTFFIGGIVIGTAVGQPVVTPVDLVEGAVDETDPEVTNITRFLLTCDNNANTSTGIEITARVRAAAVGMSIDFGQSIQAFEADLDVLSVVAALTLETTAGQRDLVSVVFARAHLHLTIVNIGDYEDRDNDGYAEADGDCNDFDASIHPGAEEICGDGIDQDCSGSDRDCAGEETVALSNGYDITFIEVVYNADGTSSWYYRVDETAAAQDLSNWVLELPDCVQVVQAAPSPYELVNPDPNANISGIKWETTDAFQSGVFTIVLDAHWDVAAVQVAAKGPDVALGVIAGPACTIIVPDNDQDGYTVADGDCDDNDPAIHPGAPEICGDGIDQDCDGTDLQCPIPSVDLPNGYRITFNGVIYNEDGSSTWTYTVTELESAQDLSNWVLELPGCVSVASASPEPNELVDPDPNAGLSGIKWQTGAGFEIGIFEVTLNAHWEIGVVNVAAKGPDVAQGEISGPSCFLVFVGQDEDGDGYTAAQGDCDDADSSIHPGAPEICEDGIDQDCSGEDLPCDALIDDDGDGFAEIDGDCDDTDAAINPDAEEICGDDIDQDCDGGDLSCQTGGCDNLNIPAGALPPPGECKVWNPALEPGQQGPPVDCDCALVQPGTCLIDSNGNALSCI